MVFVAVNWTKLPAALADLPAWDGRIVIDANNPIEAPLFKPVDLQAGCRAKCLPTSCPRARRQGVQPPSRSAPGQRSEGRRRSACCSIPQRCCGEGGRSSVIERIGFVGIDLGSLAVGGKLAQFRADRAEPESGQGGVRGR